MQSGPAVFLHPAMSRTPWHVAFLVAAAEFAKYSGLTAAVVIGGTLAVVLLLVLAVVSAPLGAGLVCWILWRSAQHGTRHASRLTASGRRRARSLGLHVVRDAARG